MIICQCCDGGALAMKRFALGTRPHSERVAEGLVNVLGGKLLLRTKFCGEPDDLQGEIIRSK